jgi:hypothetical protein
MVVGGLNAERNWCILKDINKIERKNNLFRGEKVYAINNS